MQTLGFTTSEGPCLQKDLLLALKNVTNMLQSDFTTVRGTPQATRPDIQLQIIKNPPVEAPRCNTCISWYQLSASTGRPFCYRE